MLPWLKFLTAAFLKMKMEEVGARKIFVICVILTRKCFSGTEKYQSDRPTEPDQDVPCGIKQEPVDYDERGEPYISLADQIIKELEEFSDISNELSESDNSDR